MSLWQQSHARMDKVHQERSPKGNDLAMILIGPMQIRWQPLRTCGSEPGTSQPPREPKGGAMEANRLRALSSC